MLDVAGDDVRILENVMQLMALGSILVHPPAIVFDGRVDSKVVRLQTEYY